MFGRGSNIIKDSSRGSSDDVMCVRLLAHGGYDPLGSIL